MKRFNVVMLVVLMVGLLAALPMYAAESSSSQMSNQKSSMSESKEFHSFHANDLIGKTVKNKKGEEFGKVEDVIIQNNGTTSFVVLSRGGTLGAGAKYYPVPFTTFMSNATNMAKLDSDRDVIANLDKSKLDSGPNFTDKKAKEMSGKNWQDRICSHYGAECHFM